MKKVLVCGVVRDETLVAQCTLLRQRDGYSDTSYVLTDNPQLHNFCIVSKTDLKALGTGVQERGKLLFNLTF